MSADCGRGSAIARRTGHISRLAACCARVEADSADLRDEDGLRRRIDGSIRSTAIATWSRIDPQLSAVSHSLRRVPSIPCARRLLPVAVEDGGVGWVRLEIGRKCHACRDTGIGGHRRGIRRNDGLRLLVGRQSRLDQHHLLSERSDGSPCPLCFADESGDVRRIPVCSSNR